jgi:ParB family transcriptional regulator, chromosome partitioning protein
MAKVPKLNLEKFDDMLAFETKEQPQITNGGIAELDIEILKLFPNHKFKLYEGQQLEDMAESVKAFGILLPIIVWQTEDGTYTILSGHNRVNAARIAGLTKVPVIIKTNLTPAEATLIVTETNLRQRSFTDLSHSERAFCLAEHYNALKSQGKRNDLLNEIEMLLNQHGSEVNQTSAEIPQKLQSREKLGIEYGLTRDKVARYIRMAGLIAPLLNIVDLSELGVVAAYELSFIENTELQQQIYDCMQSESFKLDMKKAELLREYYESKKLTELTIHQILSGEKLKKPKSPKKPQVKIKQSVISKYFTEQQTPKEIEETIEKALEMYFSKSDLANCETL